MIKINIFPYHIFLLRGEYTLPTIHLSLPEWIYEELKRKADEMGVQITDLVKFYIKMGLEGSLSSKGKNDDDDKYSKLEESVIYLEARLSQLEAIISELMRKVEEKEDEEEEVEILNKNEKS